jgi:DNA-binding NarL/FixJ family response regulator
MSSTGERRLLILDDDALVGLLVESVARLAGVATCLTREADEFYDAAADWGPTHVVLDLTMPGASGEEVLAELAARGCRARIIITSGADAERLAHAVAQARADGLDVAGGLPKPFVAAALRALLV